VTGNGHHDREDDIAGTPSFTSSIADALVIKDQNLFFLTDPDGRVPLRDGHGLGLYLNDFRFLRGYELTVAGRRPSTLAATAGRGFMAVIQLSTPDLTLADGSAVPQEELGIKWQRVVDGAGQALHDCLLFENFSHRRLTIPVALTFRAGFEDVFAVRDLQPDSLGTRLPPVWHDDSLNLGYLGVDGFARNLAIGFAPPPKSTDDTTAHFEVVLESRQREELLISLTVSETSDADNAQPVVHPPPNLERLEAVLGNASNTWLRHEAAVRSDSLSLNRILERSFCDLYLLRSRIGDEQFFAAGVPWFATLFGRDSLLTALQTLAYDPDIAAQTLRLLARHQGTVVDDWRDEQPGKILHELRSGEMARAGKIPHTPYYGTVDATPLFLILLARHAAWTGDLTLFNELRGAVERALTWMADHGDADGDGYLDYQRRSPLGLDNQGWKDSHDAIVNANGSKAAPPIALVEVQGYVYQAKTGISELYDRAGESDRAAQLRQEAAALKARFNRDFWLTEQDCFALARQAGGRPAAVVTSNAGHALWTGIADPDKGEATAQRLLAEDMFSGWGIRTLSARERCYNPNGYHVGSIWPHDNALIVAGLRRYGCDAAAQRVFMALLETALDLEQYRLPELFAGFSRAEYGIPVRYPVACRPQAWAAGAVPFMLESMLGLEPDAFAQQLRVVRPILPEPAYYLELRGLRVGAATAALRFDRTSDGVTVRLLEIDGPLDVIVEGAGVRV
jgi:glycogen debranching enzyme